MFFPLKKEKSLKISVLSWKIVIFSIICIIPLADFWKTKNCKKLSNDKEGKKGNDKDAKETAKKIKINVIEKKQSMD